MQGPAQAVEQEVGRVILRQIEQVRRQYRGGVIVESADQRLIAHNPFVGDTEDWLKRRPKNQPLEATHPGIILDRRRQHGADTFKIDGGTALVEWWHGPYCNVANC